MCFSGSTAPKKLVRMTEKRRTRNSPMTITGTIFRRTMRSELEYKLYIRSLPDGLRGNSHPGGIGPGPLEIFRDGRTQHSQALEVLQYKPGGYRVHTPRCRD